MILFWVTLFLLHQGHTLTPVTTVHLGEPVILACALPTEEMSRRSIYWYKQSVGDTLKSIVTLPHSASLQYAPEFPESRWKVNQDDGFCNLTIRTTIQEDEGMYHCGITEWVDFEWSGTYLLVKGNRQRTSDYSVVQLPPPSAPVRPGASVTLQCSVLSDSEKKTCPGDHSVYWFRAGSDTSHPSFLYTPGNNSEECGKTPEAHSPQRCVYNFTKSKVSSSDAGTYHCAVATCGEILFGSGTKLDIEESSLWSQNNIIFLQSAVLVVGLIAFIIYAIKKNNCDCCSALVAPEIGGQKSHRRDKDTLVYSAVLFTVMKTAIKDGEATERRRIYTALKALKAFGLDE